MKFSEKQKELIEIAKIKGFVTFENLNSVFSSPISRKANLERFAALGIFTSVDGKFKLNSEKLKELEDGTN
jgi:hypothetical protein